MIRFSTVLMAAASLFLASCATKKECATCDAKAKSASCSKDSKPCCKSGHKH